MRGGKASGDGEAGLEKRCWANPGDQEEQLPTFFLNI
jgi:hypothetical protein